MGFREICQYAFTEKVKYDKLFSGDTKDTVVTKKHMEYIPSLQLAQTIGVSKNTVTQWRKEGLPCIYIGKVTEPRRGSRPRYDLEKVKAWLEERSKKRTSVA